MVTTRPFETTPFVEPMPVTQIEITDVQTPAPDVADIVVDHTDPEPEPGWLTQHIFLSPPHPHTTVIIPSKPIRANTLDIFKV